MNPNDALQTQILSRVIGAENPTFTPETARFVLNLQFQPPDRVRMNELAARSRAGVLTENETSQLEAYLFVGSILDLMQSRARQMLKACSD